MEAPTTLEGPVVTDLLTSLPGLRACCLFPRYVAWAMPVSSLVASPAVPLFLGVNRDPFPILGDAAFSIVAVRVAVCSFQLACPCSKLALCSETLSSRFHCPGTGRGLSLAAH